MIATSEGALAVDVMSPETAERLGSAHDAATGHRFGRPPENLPSFEPAAPTRVTDPANVRIERLDFQTRRGRSRFVDMTASIYAGDPNWIAPLRIQIMKFLDPSRSPAFESLEVHPIIAMREGRVVGRMTAHIDRAYNAYHEARAGFFGFFECVNDRQVAHTMLEHGFRWLEERGMREVFGPLNFTTNHQAGLLVENFDRPPFVEEGYNPRYYEELLASFGLGKAKDLLVWWIDIASGLDTEKRARVRRIAERVTKREGVTVRHIDLSDFDAEVDRIYDLYVRAWQKNWGFVPLPKKQFRWIADDIREIGIPELLLFVELEGKPVAFALTLPNVNERLPRDGRLFPFGWTKLLGDLRKTKYARMYTLGTLPEYRKRGLESILFSETVLRAHAMGIAGGEIGWTLEDNDLINRGIESMEGRIDRRYRIFGMKLGESRS